MAYALESRTQETPASADGFSICDLLLLPFLLLAQMFARFSGHLTNLKQMRRSRPAPKDWKSFYPELRRTEWAIRQLCFEGARQIILGEELDLSAITFDPEPPETFQPPMPRSAPAMHQRIEDTARFYANPERYIRRHAARVRDRDWDHDRDDDRDWNPKSDVAMPVAVPVAVAVPVVVAIRGPPRLRSFKNTSPAPCCWNSEVAGVCQSTCCLTPGA